MNTLLLGMAGALLGLVAWALCGIGLTELGLLGRFDPIGVGVDLPAPSTMDSVLEWSFPAWILVGAATFPRFLRWALRGPGTSDQST